MKTIEITVPGSKSLTNRAIVLASLSNGISKIENISNSLDSQIMITAMKKLGVKIKKINGKLQIKGNGGVFKKISGNINVGDAGTVTRFLTAILTLVPGKITLTKSKRMKERPIKELTDALKTIGTGKVTIRGDISSQFISALLMIAPVLEKGLIINVSGRKISSSYIDMTIDLLEKFGVKVQNNKNNKIIIKKQPIAQTNFVVESDLSGASYFFAAGAVTGKVVRVNNIDLNSKQGDLAFPDLLKKMGCQVKKNIKKGWIEVKGPKILKGININMSMMPDTAQTLAVVAAFAKGKTIITGLSTLKMKETDRLKALKNELNKMKIKCDITDNSIDIEGGNPQKTVIETYGDHRMAMAFALAKLRVPGLIIKNPEVVNKSFPDFWNKFNLIKNKKLVLIGFMGSGKTTVAKILAKKLDFEVIEMDALITKQEGKNINQIFSEEGEARFRELETQIARHLREKENIVISTGGGVVINPENIKNLKINGKIIFLKTSFSEIKKRLKNIDDRPLFKNKKSAERLFKFREKLYEKHADLIVLTDGRSVEEVTYEIISKN
jgi:3-phosphoshikimate 1-carboxyvinyltransferase